MSVAKSAFTAKSTAEDILKAYPNAATGKYVVVTGGYGGIGLETCRVLANGGANVTLLGKDEKKLKDTVEDIKKNNVTKNADVDYVVCDLGSFKSIKACAETYASKNKPIDILINNAGVMACPLSYTTDGFENQIGVNHMGHAYLTRLLLPIIQKSKTSRIINVSSVAAVAFAPAEGIYFDDFDGKKSYNTWNRYGQSKLANIFFTKSLERHYPAKETGITSLALHPGVITSTDLMRHTSFSGVMQLVSNLFSNPSIVFKGLGEPGKNIPQGAATTMYCALSPDVVSGEFYSDSNVEVPKRRHAKMTDDALIEKFYDFTNKLIDEKVKSL
jgi:retinol dehydrogenase 12